MNGKISNIAIAEYDNALLCNSDILTLNVKINSDLCQDFFNVDNILQLFTHIKTGMVKYCKYYC